MANCDEFPEMYFPDSEGKHPWDYDDWNEDCISKKKLVRPNFFEEDSHGVQHGPPYNFVKVPREYLILKWFTCYEDAKTWSIELGLSFVPYEQGGYVEQCPEYGRDVNFEDSDESTIVAIYKVANDKYVRYEISTRDEYVHETWYVNCDEVISDLNIMFSDFNQNVQLLVDVYRSYIKNGHAKC